MAADSSFHGGRKSMGGTIHHRKAEKYSFPLLKNDEIIQCLAELNVQLDEADLAKARPAQLRHIYELLLCDCLDMTKEELYQPKFSGLDALRHAELHDDSVPVLHFFRSMDKLLKACGISSGFTLKDLSKPDFRRVRRNLSAIINFHKFREERLALFVQFTERGEQLAAKKAALDEERAALEAEIAKLEAAAASQQPQVRELEAACEEREAEITTLNQTQAKIRAATNGVKEVIGKVKDDIAGVEFSVLSLQEEVEEARTGLVSSPSRVKAEVAAQEDRVAAEKAALADVERKKREVRGRVAIAAAAQSEVSGMMTALTELEDELHKASEVAGQVSACQRKVDLAAGERAEQEAERGHLDAQVKRLGDKLADFRASHDMKMAASTKGKGALQAEYGEIMAEGDAAERKRKEGDGAKAALTAKLDTAQAQHEGEMTALLDHMRELQREVKGYHARLFASLATTEQGVKQQTEPVPSPGLIL